MSALDTYITTAKRAGCPPEQISNFLRAGIVLQPRQLEASAAARLCDTQGGPVEVGYGGARAGGKSHWGVAQVGADDCQRFPGLKVLVLRKVGKALKEGVTDLLRRVLGGLEYRWSPSDKTVYFPNGSRILLGHFQKESDIDAYLGLEYDLILIEEATTLSATKRRAILTCLRSSKPGWRPRCYSTTNPGGVGHNWYKRELVDAHRHGAGYVPLAEQRGLTRYIAATVDDNNFVNTEYKGQLEGLTGWQLRAWRYGDWDIAAGQYFTTFRRDVHVIPPFAVPANWRTWLALDYGFTHYSAAYLFAEGDGALYVLDEHAAQRWLVQRHAEAIHAMLGRNGMAFSRLKTAVAGADLFNDRHDGGTIANEYKKHGLKFKRAINDRVAGWSEMLARFGDVDAGIAPRMFITERCGHLIETLPLLQHDQHQPEDVLKWDTDDDGNGGDDFADACRYGTMAATKPRMTTGTVNWHEAITTSPAPLAGARTNEEIERLLDAA